MRTCQNIPRCVAWPCKCQATSLSEVTGPTFLQGWYFVNSVYVQKGAALCKVHPPMQKVDTMECGANFVPSASSPAASVKINEQHKLKMQKLVSQWPVVCYFTLLLCWCLRSAPGAQRQSGSKRIYCVHPPLIDKPHGADPGPHRRVPRRAPGAEGRWWDWRWRKVEAAARTPLCPQPRQPAELRPAIFITFIHLLQQQQQRPQPSVHHQSWQQLNLPAWVWDVQVNHLWVGVA